MLEISSVNGMKKNGLLLLLVILIEALGLLSGILGNINAAAYDSLIKPSYAPPGWVFAIVWPLLYFLMALDLYRILLIGEQGENINKSLVLFFIQLILNFFWSIIFFRFKQYGIALIELIILAAAITLTIFEFDKNDKVSACIMLPYLLWVFYGGFLNIAFWNLNK